MLSTELKGCEEDVPHIFNVRNESAGYSLRTLSWIVSVILHWKRSSTLRVLAIWVSTLGYLPFLPPSVFNAFQQEHEHTTSNTTIITKFLLQLVYGWLLSLSYKAVDRLQYVGYYWLNTLFVEGVVESCLTLKHTHILVEHRDFFWFRNILWTLKDIECKTRTCKLQTGLKWDRVLGFPGVVFRA